MTRQLDEIPWIQQDRDSCCFLYALCNALRYFGRHSPAPGDKEWERLVDIAACRHGSAIYRHVVADELGLVLEECDPRRPDIPSILTVVNPDPRGMHLHAVLVVGTHRGNMALVNYRPKGGGPVLCVKRKDHLGNLPKHLRRCLSVRLKEHCVILESGRVVHRTWDDLLNLVLTTFEEVGHGMTIAQVAKETGLDVRMTRSLLQHLARYGFAYPIYKLGQAHVWATPDIPRDRW